MKLLQANGNRSKSMAFSARKTKMALRKDFCGVKSSVLHVQ